MANLTVYHKHISTLGTLAKYNLFRQSIFRTKKCMSTTSSRNIEVEEVRINVPWGHVGGKLWGPKTTRPILVLHGWTENAGTFDRILPLLPTEVSYLAIDMPGHGRSSHFPIGMTYNIIMDSLHLINVIAHTYKWDKVSLIGHSMGAQQSFMYNAMYPDKCDMTVAIDALKPFVLPTANAIVSMRHRLQQHLLTTIRQLSASKPRTYTYDELIERLVRSLDGSLPKECASCLLERGCTKSDTNQNRYCVTLDNRVKNFPVTLLNYDLLAELAKQIRSPYLFIKASDCEYFDRRQYTEDIMAIMRSNIPDFEYANVSGKHHVHLAEPEVIGPIVSAFIEKHRIEKM